MVGGEPWPPESYGATAAPAPVPAQAAPAEAAPAPAAAAPAAAPVGAAAPQTRRVAQAVAGADAVPLRRGLPRSPGGEPWPPEGFAPAPVEYVEVVALSAETPDAAPAEAIAVSESAGAQGAPAPVVAAVESGPLPSPQTVWPGRAAQVFAAERRAGVKIEHPEPKRHGPFTAFQWAGAIVVAGFGLLLAAGMAVALTRWFLSLPFMLDFLAAYPGEYHLPAGAPVGIPSWIGWQHFFNVFLMVLIIRSGLQVRYDKRPSAFWTPRGGRGGKISLSLWFHQSLDVLWLTNGIIFVVLLFVTGQWMRIVPTSWEVFPNALSAALQYVSLDWPTENGWVNYNGLQQLAYFTTVFIAAPLAAITGVRMSGFWPKNAPALNRAYPVEWARAVHFPVMIYFVLFIIVHVTLVFATGALRNLNHMYASLGSVDGVQYADNWTGFWIFFASMVVIAAGWVAARPLVLAPIARLFGTVSAR